MMSRLAHNWVYGGGLAAILLLGIMPALSAHWSLGLKIVFLTLPVYMLHQYEEHDDDRLSRFIDRYVGEGQPMLTTTEIFLINIPGVWGLNAAIFILAAKVSLGYGLASFYLMIVNALSHVGFGVALRRYNPGLLTAIFFFIPLSAWGLVTIGAEGADTWLDHVIGLSIAVCIHALILVRIITRARAARVSPRLRD